MDDSINGLKNRGVQDILVLCADGLTGLKEAISAIYPKREYFSAQIRKIMYTTNAIESLNSTYKRINRNRNVFSTDMSLLKVLYLSTLKAEKKWSFRAKNWDLCLSQFRIMYEGRI